jgi:hypothetical protein
MLGKPKKVWWKWIISVSDKKAINVYFIAFHLEVLQTMVGLLPNQNKF